MKTLKEIWRSLTPFQRVIIAPFAPILAVGAAILWALGQLMSAFDKVIYGGNPPADHW